MAEDFLEPSDVDVGRGRSGLESAASEIAPGRRCSSPSAYFPFSHSADPRGAVEFPGRARGHAGDECRGSRRTRCTCARCSVLHLMNSFVDSSISRIVLGWSRASGSRGTSWHVGAVTSVGDMQGCIPATGVPGDRFRRRRRGWPATIHQGLHSRARHRRRPHAHSQNDPRRLARPTWHARSDAHCDEAPAERAG